MIHREKVSLIDKEHVNVSLTRQCELLEISRASVYYQPIVDEKDIPTMKAEFEKNPALLAQHANLGLAIGYNSQLKDFLDARGIKAEIQGRIKNVYSIYAKLTRKGLNDVDELLLCFV